MESQTLRCQVFLCSQTRFGLNLWYMKLDVKIINPDHILFEGTAEYVLAPGVKGMIGILPGHVPMFAELIHGEIYIKGEIEEIVALESGILNVKSDVVDHFGRWIAVQVLTSFHILPFNDYVIYITI